MSVCLIWCLCCIQSWLKKAEDQGSAILLNVKDVQRAHDKLLIHKVSEF